MNVDIAITYAHGLGIAALLTMAFGQTSRRAWPSQMKSVLIGIVFGIGAVVAIAAPFEIKQGVVVDARAIIVALGAAFGGIPAAIVSATIAGVYRYQLGGQGVLPGTLCVFFAAAIGLAWSLIVRPRIRSVALRLAILALAIPFSLAAIFVIPWEQAVRALGVMLLPNVLSSLVATVVLGTLMEKEVAKIEAEERLRERATTDPLTGAGNRAEFDDRLARCLARDTGVRSATSLLIIDADLFKSINDRFGHAAGDAVLKCMAEIMRSAISPVDYLARLGGEEFGIILETRSPNRALKVAETIRAAIAAEKFPAKDHAFGATVSVGCAVTGKGETVDSLYESADAALYIAKREGRNLVRMANMPVDISNTGPVLTTISAA